MLKELEPASVSLYASFKQVEELAKRLIAKEIGRIIPVSIEADDEELRIRVEIDDRSLCDDEAIYLASRGYAAHQPYRSAHFVLEALTEGVPYDILPGLGYEEDDDAYFLIEVRYAWYKSKNE